MVSQSNRYLKGVRVKDTEGFPVGKDPPIGPVHRRTFTTTKGIDHEASAHPPRDRSGGRHRLGVRRRRIRRHARPRPDVRHARLRLRADDGILGDAQPGHDGRRQVRDGHDPDDVDRHLTVGTVKSLAEM